MVRLLARAILVMSRTLWLPSRAARSILGALPQSLQYMNLWLGSSARERGSSSPFQSSTRRLEPSRRDTSSLLSPMSTQYRLWATQSTAMPSG
uniref:Putative secreted protein n=1 Tax=Ixodes ricinus TaxID=34613 RepID=A0A6B0UCH0_IXORI